ncbi:hypothetical protein ACOME3_002525 [Neoechinorhynchus agilis]
MGNTKGKMGYSSSVSKSRSQNDPEMTKYINVIDQQSVQHITVSTQSRTMNAAARKMIISSDNNKTQIQYEFPVVQKKKQNFVSLCCFKWFHRGGSRKCKVLGRNAMNNPANGARALARGSLNDEDTSDFPIKSIRICRPSNDLSSAVFDSQYNIVINPDHQYSQQITEPHETENANTTADNFDDRTNIASDKP